MAKQLSIGEAAKYLGISRDTLRRWEKKGKIIPYRSPSNRRYYSQDQLDSLIEKPEENVSRRPSSGSLNLVVYSLLALLVAVILAYVSQTFLL